MSLEGADRKPRLNRHVFRLCLGVTAALLVVAIVFITRATQQTRDDARRTQSRNNLKQLGIAASNYESAFNTLPPWKSVDAEGKSLQGWQLLIFPYLEANPLWSMVDRSVAWDHSRNAFVFRQTIPGFLNPGESGYTDEQGYALTHYAANSELVRAGTTASLDDLKKGKSQTVLFGEVGESFQPWGKPDNTRQASAPLNSGPNSFGRYSRDGAFLCMADGSVRFVTNSIDSAVEPQKRDGKSQGIIYSTRKLDVCPDLTAETQYDPQGNLIAIWVPWRDNGNYGVPWPDLDRSDQQLLSLEPLDRLESLYAREGDFTDAFLKRLGELPSLQSVVISGKRITDAGVAHLERLPKLKLLQIAAPRVTEGAILQLKRTLPNCEIRFRKESKEKLD